MKKGFDDIAMLKAVDIVFQCISFVLMILCMTVWGFSVMGLYVMGIAHFISSAAWLAIHHLNVIPQKDLSRRIRKAIVIISVILIVSILIVPELFLLESCLMLLAGPMLGISYFVITVQEYNYFKTARKPYYLL